MFQQAMQNPQQFLQQFEAFKRNFQQSGQNPQQVVQSLLNSGRMTQDQFNQQHGEPDDGNAHVIKRKV